MLNLIFFEHSTKFVHGLNSITFTWIIQRIFSILLPTANDVNRYYEDNKDGRIACIVTVEKEEITFTWMCTHTYAMLDPPSFRVAPIHRLGTYCQLEKHNSKE